MRIRCADFVAGAASASGIAVVIDVFRACSLVAHALAAGATRVIPLEDADQCCGSAGIYNLVEPDTSDAVLAPKLARIAESGADWVATGNPGCMMQIGAGLLRSGSRARVVHPIELLDASYEQGT